MTNQDRKRAMELMVIVGKYGNHLESCCSNTSDSNPASDYCDCGLSTAQASFRELGEIVLRG